MPKDPSPVGDPQPDTATKVEEAVLAMIEDRGVLNGLNLNEVAKAAGVNRTLVYHHFGSRRALLRSAIKHELRKRQVETTPVEPMRLGARVVHGLHALLKGGSWLRLTTLLHLDGSSAPRLMPNADSTLLRLERDRALGLTPDIDDLPALHASYAAALYGYALYRGIFARDLNIDVEELDARVMAQLEQLFDPPPRTDPKDVD